MLKKIIKASPEFIEKPVRSIYSTLPSRIRYGKTFCETLDFLNKSQNFDKDKLEEYQFGKLIEVLNFCNSFVPFYQKKWAEYGINIKQIKDFSDLKKLPYTTKDDLINYSENFVPTIFRKSKLIISRTGGTTGSPGKLYTTYEALQKETAFFARYWSWHGYSYGKDRCAILRGSYEIQEEVERKGEMHYMSAFNLNKDKLIKYINYLNINRISFLQAYPSLAYNLFKTAYEEDLIKKISSLRVVFCASEKMYPFQKAFIENNFNTKCFIHYGHQEQGALLQMVDSENYSIISEYGYTEFEDLDLLGSNLKEIISTGFLNLATPLIRYRTNDFAELDEEIKKTKFPYCNIIKDIAGRCGDILITPKGNIIQPNHLEYAIRYIENFRDCLIVQDGATHLTVLVVPKDTYTDEEGNSYKEKILWRLNDVMDIDIKLVKSIDRPLNCKKQYTMNIFNK